MWHIVSQACARLVFCLLLGGTALSCPVVKSPTKTAGTVSRPESGSGIEAEVPDRALDAPTEARAADDGGADASLDSLMEALRLGRIVPLDPEPMHPFLSALAGVEAGDRDVVRVLHYGDSHTAAETLCTSIRRELQQRFGDGGRGFVLLGRPWRWYAPDDVIIDARGTWRPLRHTLAEDSDRQDGRYGVAGIAVETGEKASVSRIATVPGEGFGDRMSSVDIFFLKRPGGGAFSIHVDGVRKGTVSTARRRIGSGFFRLRFPEGNHELEIRVKAGEEVRFFGAAIENDGPGVVYDTLGINGAFFFTPLNWDASLIEEQVGRRNPDLIIAMYGTNDADARHLTTKVYTDLVKRAISRLREGAPRAACLILGPPDRDMGLPVGVKSAHLTRIIDVQQAVADEVGCAFIDIQELMGGPGSYEIWRRRGLAKSDGVHFTPTGYALLGELIAGQLLAAYDGFCGKSAQPDPANQLESVEKQ
ncbi:MAG: GDSL-type esterase/lipase family protein [Myxococcota bacterium]|nr:GDSL-type esterase/lipase family protein [Myxococcota bacterium]